MRYYFLGLCYSNREKNSNKPDIVVKNNKRNTCFLIDVSVSTDNNISVKEYNKISKYKDLEIEIEKM